MNVLCFTFSIVPIVWGKCQGLDIPRQTGQCNIKHGRLRERTAMVLPA